MLFLDRLTTALNELRSRRPKYMVKSATPDVTKICTTCHAELPKDTAHFATDKGKPDGFKSICKSCDAIRKGIYRTKLKPGAMYGAVVGDYERLFKLQGGACAICGVDGADPRNRRKGRLALDHNHTTGKVRGLLCASCNISLGAMGDDAGLLSRAVNYMRAGGVET